LRRLHSAFDSHAGVGEPDDDPFLLYTTTAALARQRSSGFVQEGNTYDAAGNLATRTVNNGVT
jgi:hypothetical protein